MYARYRSKILYSTDLSPKGGTKRKNSVNNDILPPSAGIRVLSIVPRYATTGPQFWLHKFCYHDHREKVRNPIEPIRPHSQLLRDRQRHHGHFRQLSRQSQAHSSLDCHW